MRNNNTDWNEIRRLFPATKKYTYINAAEGSPISIQAAEAGKCFYDEMLAHGDLVWEEWLERVQQVREQVARFINAEPQEIAFMLNTSHGMNLIAEMLQGKGNVVIMNDEFPSSTFPWLHRKYKVDFVQPVNHIYTSENIEATLSSDSKILVSSYVQYCTGFRQDLVKLGRLCQSKNLIYIVNATQAMGAMPIDVKQANIDFLVFTSLKWPMAGYGIGVIYINRKWLDRIQTPFAGWQSVVNPDLMDNKKINLKKEASQLELGCPHFPNIFALGGALELLDSIGQENIKTRIFELNSYLVGRLAELNLEIGSPLEDKYRSGITIVKIPNAKEVVEKLISRNIIVSQRGEGVRVSMHIYNNKEDIDTFIETLEVLIR